MLEPVLGAEMRKFATCSIGRIDDFLSKADSYLSESPKRLITCRFNIIF